MGTYSDSFCGASMDALSFYKITVASVLLSVGVIIAYVGYFALKQFVNILWYHFMRSVEVTNSVVSYCDTRANLLQWLQNNVETKRLPHINVGFDSRREENGQTIYELKNSPRYQTTHYFTYKGHWVLLSRYYVKNVISNDVTWESITLTTFRTNESILGDIMEEVRLLFEEQPLTDDKTRFYFANDGYWTECGTGKRKRPLTSVILNTTTANKINGDLREFLDTSKWYQDRGIPYRRGYLLYGPPGCGKSSFVKAIAGEINYSICIMSLSSKNLNDDTLNGLMNSTPENCIILLEDVDAAFPNRDIQDDDDDDKKGEKKKKQQTAQVSENGTGKVTLRGLLNALDGVASTEGRIIFLTTNYIDRLDSAMTRPGRVDLKVSIDLPDDDQLFRMFTHFYPDANVETDAKEFVRKIRALKKPKVSMAMVQGHFMMHKYDYKDMMNGIEQYFEEQFFSLNQKN
ncbi:hypothetical protein HA402_014310 [Bradysia odoriphaga]|nr:hypothetical protein HA402_014310 [Bradysia odoriphaga]